MENSEVVETVVTEVAEGAITNSGYRKLGIGALVVGGLAALVWGIPKLIKRIKAKRASKKVVATQAAEVEVGDVEDKE